MKLLPKARPVQCKLILGDKVINTKSDLQDNFFLSEMISLGDRFSRLLCRNDELKEYANNVYSIFNDKERDEEVALELIKLFFDVGNKTLIDILIDWQNEGKKTAILSDLCSYVSLDIPNALKLLQNRKENDQWMLDKLKEVGDIIKNIQYNHDREGVCASFCFEYSKYLKKYDERQSRRWLKEASDFGHKDAKKQLENELDSTENLPIELSIPVKGYHVKLMKVGEENSAFYICQEIIERGLFGMH